MLEKMEGLALEDSAFTLFGKNWALITAGEPGDYNTMTASWGGLGVLWNKNVATAYIRPQRYTKVFVEKNDTFTMSFFDEKYRAALQFCGSHSGRDCNKAKETGLTPVALDDSTTFAQARLVLVCKKLFTQEMKEEAFLDKKILEDCYPKRDLHTVYIGEIIAAYQKRLPE